MRVISVIRPQSQSTNGTDVLVRVVCLLVTLEAIRILKGHAALVAREWSFVRVNRCVSTEHRGGIKRFATHFTDVCGLSNRFGRVLLLVQGQVVFRVQDQVAVFASEKGKRDWVIISKATQLSIRLLT